MANELHRRMADMIQRYSTNFIPHISDSRYLDSDYYNVALTGSTGNVGCIMLQILLQDPKVGTVYVLNRRNGLPAKERVTQAFQEKGLDSTILDTSPTRLLYLEIDFSKKHLGLNDAEYTNLRNNVTHIIHSAWELRFNVDLEYFEPMHIAGVRNLIDLALSSPHRRCPRLVFLSSLAAAIEYRGPSDVPVIGKTIGQILVPERPIDDFSMVIQDQGYGQSKYVCERMIVNAIQFGLRATVCRVGQLCGMSTNGQWSKHEYSTILLRAILTMRICPNDMPSFRWLPCDIAASALLKQTFADFEDLQYFSVESPYPTPWSHVCEALETLPVQPLYFVPYTTLLEALKTNSKSPVTSLLMFYKQRIENFKTSAALGWNRSIEVAPELAGNGCLTAENFRSYIRYQQKQLATTTESLGDAAMGGVIPSSAFQYQLYNDMASPAAPGLFFAFAAMVLLIFVSVSVPTWNAIYFLRVFTEGHDIRFGIFGFTGSGRSVGYTFDPSIVGLSNTNLNNTVIRGLTSALILHPIGAALAALAVLFGLCGAAYSRVGTIFMTLTTTIAALVTLVAFIIDMVLWGIARERIRHDGPAGTTATLGNANWLTLAARNRNAGYY
ncbi:putative secondary metabolism biosyntheticenzyme [Clathrus columnatus]|uniref:Secondary metabolism biosyntheticenzyme n=1 Tax=Clathrus columnatus TaxID=1419009 RepID=A0AAV5AGV6_9AGAM|nr:putative secondary metabolism biosyntheticenzyme [Clathrus columnatus]